MTNSSTSSLTNSQLSTVNSQLKKGDALSLPKGWEVKKLGDLCTIQLGKTPHRKTERYWDKDKNTSNCWLSIADMVHGKELFDSKEYVSNLGAENINITPKGTLILSFKLTIGRVSFAGKDLFTNEAIASLIGLSGNINKKYLFYYFTFFDWDKATDGDTKVKGKTLNKAKLKALSIIAPPLQEQQHIVEILDKAFSAIDKAAQNTQQNLSNAKEVFQSKLQAIFDNGKLKVENGEWEEKTLKEVSEDFGRGKSKHRPRNDKKLYGGDYPFIQTGDIRNCEHYITDYSQTYNDTGLAQSKLWPTGTICITIAANIAETGILSFDSCFPDSVIGIVVNTKITNVDFVEYLLQSFKVNIQSLGKGSAQDNVNMGTFKNKLFPFPSVEQQQHIIKQLNELSNETKKLETIYQKKIADLGELKKSILQKAFRGEL